MSATLVAPVYTAQDFETASIRSAAPSYVSETPSYQSSGAPLAPPPYSPRRTAEPAPPARSETPTQQQPTVGLPPVPRVAPGNVPNLYSYRLPTWSANNALARRQYHSVAERRASANRITNDLPRRLPPVEQEPEPARPLEDPYLVGEVAAASARRERLAREAGDDILIREDKQWDWLLGLWPLGVGVPS
jgi:hypothetical protein